jgi:hypothetical protein
MLFALCVVTGLSQICCAQSDNTAPPAWYGELDTGVRSFRFFIRPDHRPPGDQWKLLSLDEGEAEFTLDAFRNDGNTLSFELKKTGATWDGKLNAARDRAEGKWKQNGTTLDLTLRQVSQRPADKPSEVWSGELSVLFQKLPLQFRVYRDADGNEHIRMAEGRRLSHHQNNRGQPLEPAGSAGGRQIRRRAGP